MALIRDGAAAARRTAFKTTELTPSPPSEILLPRAPFVRAMSIAVAMLLSRFGSYISAVADGELPSQPPARSTLPSGSRVAVWPERR